MAPRLTFALAAAAAVTAVASAQYGGASPKCYALGERCEGAYGYDYVESYPCCDEKATCSGQDSYYGKVCAMAEEYNSYNPYPVKTEAPISVDYYTTKKAADPVDYYTKKAADPVDYPAYPVKTEAPTKDYGYPTEAPTKDYGYGGESPKVDYPKKKYGYEHPKCYEIGERCCGADGYEFVEWLGCCDPKATCTGKDEHYGKVCEIASPYHHSYGEYAPKCYKLGERCVGAAGYDYVEWCPCCDEGATCTGKDEHYGLVCEIAEHKDYGYGYEKPTYAPEYPVATADPVDAYYPVTDPPTVYYTTKMAEEHKTKPSYTTEYATTKYAEVAK